MEKRRGLGRLWRFSENQVLFRKQLFRKRTILGESRRLEKQRQDLRQRELHAKNPLERHTWRV